MLLSLMLADSAQVNSGKLYVLGGCINQIPQNVPFAFAGYVLVPWDRTNQRHMLTIELFTSDGQPVAVDTPIGKQEFKMVAEFEIGRPPGVPAGTEFTMPVAVQLGPLAIVPGRYEFRCSLPEMPSVQKIAFDVTI